MFDASKKISDFKHPSDSSKPLFNQEDIEKTLLVDDQYMAIGDKDHMITSKKFLKFADSCPLAPPQKKQTWYHYQFPTGLEEPNEAMVIKNDLTKVHMELNKKGDDNQLYYICNLISRCYLVKTLLSPKTPIQMIL